MYIKKTFITAILIFTGVIFSYAQQTTDKKAVIESLESFHQAIVENDNKKARELLADSARILESGNMETKDEYLSHHFKLDGKFLSTMNREIESRRVTVKENVAWVSTKSRTWGNYHDRELELNSLELAILKKTENGWKIAALHWSSRKRD